MSSSSFAIWYKSCWKNSVKNKVLFRSGTYENNDNNTISIIGVVLE